MPCAGAAGEDCGGSYVMLAFNFTCDDDGGGGGGQKKAKNKNNNKNNNSISDPPTTQDYYEGIMARLMKRIPSLSWFWVWTPEDWEWGSMSSDDPTFQAALAGYNQGVWLHLPCLWLFVG